MERGKRSRREPESGEGKEDGTDYFPRGREQCISVLVCREAAQGRSVLRGSSDDTICGRRGRGDKTRHHYCEIHTGETIRHYNGRAGGEGTAEVSGPGARILGLGDVPPELTGVYGYSL